MNVVEYIGNIHNKWQKYAATLIIRASKQTHFILLKINKNFYPIKGEM